MDRHDNCRVISEHQTFIITAIFVARRRNNLRDNQEKYINVRLEVLMVVKIPILVFWVATPCGLIGRYQHFGVSEDRDSTT
jgi:cytochrome c-type biogenesis protein CcmH/NrfG